MGRVLVTGAGGFIGRALVPALERAGHEVVGLASRDGSIDDPAVFESLADVEFSRAFHLAAKTYVPDSWNDPVGFCRVNSIGVANVLEFCRRRGTPATCVSAYLYGQPDALPIAENAAIRPNNPYALSKFLGERICEFYATMCDVPVTVIRPFNAYGDGQDIRFLIPSIVHQAVHGESIVVQDLRPKRDYVFLDDLVEALMLTMEHAGGYQVYNIGSGTSLSVQAIIDAVQTAAGTAKEVVSRQSERRHEIDDVIADISLAAKCLHWRPRHTFEQGVRKMLRAARGEPS